MLRFLTSPIELVVPQTNGRVIDQDGSVVDGVYVTGWAKRGPRGIIGTNKKCARDTVLSLLADARAGRLPEKGTLDAPTVHAVMAQRQPDLVDQLGWLPIDDHEQVAGRADGRSRRKLTDPAQMLQIARQSRGR